MTAVERLKAIAELANLENCISDETAEGYGDTTMKRIKLPIPKEYGGGHATGATLEDAVKNLIERVISNAGYSNKNATPLFSECYEKWIAIKEGQEKSPVTIATYKGIAKSHLLPFLDGKQIGEITPDDIQLYFNSIRKLSKSMSTQSKAILTGVFERATRNDIITKNPMAYKYDVSRKEGKKVVLQDDDFIGVINQLDTLKKPYKKDYLYACILFFTGLRKSEILGLRWKDIDFTRETINVTNAVKYPNGQNEPVTGTPKDDSTGTVTLLSLLAERIQPYAGKPEEYVIAYSDTEPEKPITNSIFQKMWKRITKRIDLKGATSHSFRHTYATMLNAHCANVDTKTLQSALRHKTPDLAMRIYAEENESKTREAEREYDTFLRAAMEQKQEHNTERATA